MDEYVCIVNDNLTFRPIQEVVRCRDCANAVPNSEHDGYIRCMMHNNTHLDTEQFMEADGFCSLGERREE